MLPLLEFAPSYETVDPYLMVLRSCDRRHAQCVTAVRLSLAMSFSDRSVELTYDVYSTCWRAIPLVVLSIQSEMDGFNLITVFAEIAAVLPRGAVRKLARQCIETLTIHAATHMIDLVDRVGYFRVVKPA